jgi:hypothetical protein
MLRMKTLSATTFSWNSRCRCTARRIVSLLKANSTIGMKAAAVACAGGYRRVKAHMVGLLNLFAITQS